MEDKEQKNLCKCINYIYIIQSTCSLFCCTWTRYFLTGHRSVLALLLIASYFFFFGSIFKVQYSIHIWRPSDSPVSEDAGIEARTAATFALVVCPSNHSDRCHPRCFIHVFVLNTLHGFWHPEAQYSLACYQYLSVTYLSIDNVKHNKYACNQITVFGNKTSLCSSLQDK